jgi:F-type H+-transporting ATPase subunit delta
VIADRYADALFQAAQTGGDALLAEVDAQLLGLVDTLSQSPELNQAWKSPVVSVFQKQSVARSLLAGRAHPLVLNTLLLLFERKRGALIERVQMGFRKRYDSVRRRALVKVVSALPLDDGQASQLSSQLQQQLGMAVEMKTEVDASLIGGCVLTIDDQVVDYSLKGRLDAMRLALR